MLDLTKNNFWVFGDSFCDNRWDVSVGRYLQTKYSSHSITHFYNYAASSMDTQTIIDNWIKLLPHMNEADVIVVCVSDISRTRYPNKTEFLHTLPHQPNPYNAPEINSYFRYAPVGYDPSVDAHSHKLDVPFYNSKEFAQFAKLENTILSTKSYNDSKVDIIEALYKLTPCHKKFIYTWTDDDILKSENIHSKEWITENIMNGSWETQHSDWVKTNGKTGHENDLHLSDGCDKLMAEYFIKEFDL